MKVKVKCGVFNYNGNNYKNGQVLNVNGDLNSVKTLIQMNDLEVIKEEVKPMEEDVKPKNRSRKSKFVE